MVERETSASLDKLGAEPEARKFLVDVSKPGRVTLSVVGTAPVQKMLRAYPQLNHVLRVSLG